MNNMGFFNPFGSSGSGGGGGGGSTANYSVKTFTDSSGQVSYKLTKNGTAVGDVISFNGSNMLVNYGGELVVLNSAIAGIEEALDKTYNFTTFTELGINTQNKTLSQLSAELAAKNLEEGTVVTGRVYSEALPYNNYGNAEVLVNNSIFWWKTSSTTISPYSWNAIVVGNTVKMDWTPTYYQLPIASAQSLGGVKIGDNVQIAPDGTISVITTKGDTGTGIASIAKTSSSGLNDIYTITYTDSTTSTFTVTNGATITGGSIGQTGHLILTMSDGKTIDAGALPTDNEVEVTTTSSQPADPNVELWVDLSTQQTLSIPEINDSSTSSTQDTWSCKKIYNEQQKQEEEIGVVANRGAKNLASKNSGSGTNSTAISKTPITLPIGDYICSFSASSYSGNAAFELWDASNSQQYVKELTVAGSNSFKFTVTGDMSVAKYSLYVNNATISDFMIRPAAITDSTFVPYAKTNRELTVAEDEDRAALIYQVDSGAKNLSAVNFVTNQQNYIDIDVNLKAGKYIISAGSISTTSSDTSIRIGVYKKPNNLLYTYIDVGSNKYSEFEISDNADTVRVFASNSASISSGESLTFSDFMICTATDWAISQKFVPYALPNPELTAKEQANENNISYIENQGSKNKLLITRTSGTVGDFSIVKNSNDFLEFSGTASSDTNIILHTGYKINVLKGLKYYDNLEGDPRFIRKIVYSNNGSSQLVQNTMTNGYTISSQYPYYNMYITIVSGTQLTDFEYTPMVCAEGLYNADSTIEPYAPTNRELYEMILALR